MLSDLCELIGAGLIVYAAYIYAPAAAIAAAGFACIAIGYILDRRAP